MGEEVILPVEEVILFCGGGYSHSCDFSVSPSPFGLDFVTLDFGTSDLGLTIEIPNPVNFTQIITFPVPCNGVTQ